MKLNTTGSIYYIVMQKKAHAQETVYVIKLVLNFSPIRHIPLPRK